MVSPNVPDAPLVPAVFVNRDAATRAVDRLIQAGINKEDIGVVVPVREPNRIREDSASDVLTGAALGAAAGGRLGAVSVLDRLDLDHSWQELEIEHHSGQPAPIGGRR